ncbi:hypothetical protein BB341_18370 [Streptomyces clavuligerus]|nr:hypothetical protein BB341_18370 [Streptomyces clavuligerus]AXU14665.1 hypothetical protein D1794_19190 [Streptomyces clavuligerus]EDY49365.1 hypothetical protein SSCG_02393 [Streptomyces clavuligerus]EDY53012.1 hypothetical protein SSCG_05872 [Streptomyces clavuligerus]QCS07435.1 hypothetical protein CRV15_18545 [Streptomyces clavuligerus]
MVADPDGPAARGAPLPVPGPRSRPPVPFLIIPFRPFPFRPFAIRPFAIRPFAFPLRPFVV